MIGRYGIDQLVIEKRYWKTPAEDCNVIGYPKRRELVKTAADAEHSGHETEISYEGMRHLLAHDYAERHTTDPERGDYEAHRLRGEEAYVRMPDSQIAAIFRKNIQRSD